jgi:hypothetical protein
VNPVFKFLWSLLFVTAAGLTLWACGDDDTDVPPPAQDVQGDGDDGLPFIEAHDIQPDVYGEVFVYEFNHKGQDYRCFVVFDAGFECEETSP